MSINVTDISGNRNDKIANAAKVLGRSEDRQTVFLAIYTGKKKLKTVSEILANTKLKSNVRVLQEGKKLASEDIVTQTKVNGETAYGKIDFYSQNKNVIISLARNKEKLKRFPTKVTPQMQGGTIKVAFPRKLVDVKPISIDNIDSFSKVKNFKKINLQQNKPLNESKIKEGLKKIIGEEGNFTDWGGETDDLYSTRLKLNGKRVSVAFGLKGKGTTGTLTPKKMGKNGDQIQRLFKSPADVFLVQYHGQIAESVIDQMQSMAIAKSVTENKKIYFGTIDGKDILRLLTAYSTYFK